MSATRLRTTLPPAPAPTWIAGGPLGLLSGVR